MSRLHPLELSKILASKVRTKLIVPTSGEIKLTRKFEVKTMFKAKQAMHAPTKSRNVECLCELQQWVAQVIDSAERNGDTHKKNKFLALQAELEN